jgi:hypothetical protein
MTWSKLLIGSLLYGAVIVGIALVVQASPQTAQARPRDGFPSAEERQAVALERIAQLLERKCR